MAGRKISGHALRIARADAHHDKTLTEVAEDMDISASYLSDLENERKPVAVIDTLDRIARHYGMRLEIRLVSNPHPGVEICYQL